MQIVIDIAKGRYEEILSGKSFITYQSDIRKVIKNGTILLKGHGKLVDVNSIPKEDKDIVVKSLLREGTIAHVGAITLEEYVNNLPTIIEADKESEG